MLFLYLGNRLGNYFHELACAEASGLHFITVHHQWDLTGFIIRYQYAIDHTLLKTYLYIYDMQECYLYKVI